MSIHRYTSTWRGTTFNPHLDDTGFTDDPAHLLKANLASRYVLEQVNVNRVSAQDYRELRQYLEGAEPNEAYEGVRAITAQGFMQGSSVADLEDKAWALNELFSIAACRAAAVATTPKGVLPYDFKRASAGGAKALRFYARPGPARPVWIGHTREGLIRPFSWQLVAFDPFAYDQVAVVSGNVSTGAPVNVTNPGNIYTAAQLTMVFSANSNANVTINNLTTGQTLVLDLSTFGANTLVIDVARSTIVRSSDGVSQYGKRVSGFLSSLFLVPGVNSIRIDNALNCTGATFSIRGAYA